MSEAEHIIEAARDGYGLQELHEGIYYDQRDGRVVDIRQMIEDEADYPIRKTGSYTITDVDSFVDYLNKHGRMETELWASPKVGTVKAVIDAHDVDHAGRSEHTATLSLALDADWMQWVQKSGQLMAQAEFAEFIEDHLPNFVSPKAADMLELAQTFQATTKVDFQSSHRVKSGETQLMYAEQTAASAGRKGNLVIPDTLSLGLSPFKGVAPYNVNARFRYRIVDQQLRIGYRLDRPDRVQDAAFEDILTAIQNETSRTIWRQ